MVYMDQFMEVHVYTSYALRDAVPKPVLRGATETLFSRERWREPRFAPVPLTLAHLLLFIAVLMGACTRLVRQHPSRSDGRCGSEQTLSVQRYMRAGSIVNAIT